MTSVGRESDDSILLKECISCDHYGLKNIWTPRLGKVLLVRRAVALLKADQTVVGQVPREFSRVLLAQEKRKRETKF